MKTYAIIVKGTNEKAELLADRMDLKDANIMEDGENVVVLFERKANSLMEAINSVIKDMVRLEISPHTAEAQDPNDEIPTNPDSDICARAANALFVTLGTTAAKVSGNNTQELATHISAMTRSILQSSVTAVASLSTDQATKEMLESAMHNIFDDAITEGIECGLNKRSEARKLFGITDDDDDEDDEPTYH